MNKTELVFSMTFDPGDALIFRKLFDQVSGVFFSYLKDNHAELWGDRTSHVVVEFRQEKEIFLTVKLANTTKEVFIDCKMDTGTDIGTQAIPCHLAIVDHSTGKTLQYHAAIEHGVLVTHGLASKVKP